MCRYQIPARTGIRGMISTGKYRTSSKMVLPLDLFNQLEFHNTLNSNVVEARGVEPLSIKRSARPSTCLGDL